VTDETEAKRCLLDGLKEGRAKPATAPDYPGARAVAANPGFPGTLPATWNLPRRNPNFTGREDLLGALRQSLLDGGHAALTQALVGLGGLGKTQCAIEYAHRHAGEYQCAWWVRSEEPAQCASDFAALAAELDLPEKGEPDQRVIVTAVRRWLERNGGWLLVFDNVPHPDALKDYLPARTPGHLFITSRDPNWGGTAAPVRVPIFPRTESVAFLQKRTRCSETEADALAHELGDLPLALEQAAAYIVATGCTTAAYLDLLRSRRQELWQDERPPEGYQATVATTWSLSMTEAAAECPAAADLLNLCAFLAPDDIPLPLLRDGADLLPDSVAPTAKDPLLLNRALAALQRYSLATVRGDALSLHRLVQAVVRDGLSPGDQRTWAAAAVRIVSSGFPPESGDVRTWPECALLLPHALVAAGHAEGLGVAGEATGHALDRAATYVQGRAAFAQARGLFERALTIAEGAFGPDHPNVAAVANNLGGVLRDLGDLAGAKAHFERALRIDEQAYGPDHPNVAIRVSNLGRVLQDLGDLAGAKAHLERALRIDEQAYGPDHPDVARDVNNLGGVLHALGDLAGAKANFERALWIFERFLGPEHPNTLTVRRNLEGLEAEIAQSQASPDP
jgi:tetratricopeptide (TPR) repeat protein